MTDCTENDGPTTPYPRICAHRGLSALLPENTLPAFEAAIDAGAQEIEFDLRPTGDGRIAVRHDPIREDLPPDHLTFEGLLDRLARRVVMNIHVKSPEPIQRIAAAIDRHSCREYVYITGNAPVMEAALAHAPGITRCCNAGNKDFTIVKQALHYKAQKLQFYVPFLSQELVDEARAHGIRCNVFFTDDPQQAREFFEMGIDTVLTNNCAQVKTKGEPS